MRRSVDVLHRRGHVDLDGVLAELAAVSARLEVTERELERLRQLPELKLGQRLRQPVDAIARRRAATDPPAGVAEGAESRHSHAAAPELAAVALVRNRRRSIEPTLTWLADRGIDDVAVVDNATSDPLTLNALQDLDVVVHRSEEDLGDAAPWALGAMARPLAVADVLIVGEDTVVSASAPPDLIDRLRTELLHAPDVGAVDLVAPVDRQPVAWMRMVRRGGAPSARVLRVEQPWIELASDAVDPDEPQERYARLHEVDRPRTGPAPVTST